MSEERQDLAALDDPEFLAERRRVREELERTPPPGSADLAAGSRRWTRSSSAGPEPHGHRPVKGVTSEHGSGDLCPSGQGRTNARGRNTASRTGGPRRRCPRKLPLPAARTAEGFVTAGAPGHCRPLLSDAAAVARPL